MSGDRYRVRCLCCRMEGDLADMKPTYYYIHEGRCDAWMREREANAPWFVPSLWPLPGQKLMRYFAIGLTVLAVLTVLS